MTNYMCEECGAIKPVHEACCTSKQLIKLYEDCKSNQSFTPGSASTYLEMERARQRESDLVREVALLRKSLLEIVRLYHAYELPHQYMAEEAKRALREIRSNV